MTRSPAGKMLDIWPKLPIVIRVSGIIEDEIDDVIAALKHHDRVCGIHLTDVSDYGLEPLMEAIQDMSPALTDLHLDLGSVLSTVPFVLDPFLGGTASC